MQVSKTPIAEPAPKRRLGTVHDVADVLCVSDRPVYRLKDAGKMPQPIRLGSAVRWDMESVMDWITAGCPPLEKRSRK